MLPRQDQHDEDALNALACATLYRMRFFAALRMTVRRRAQGFAVTPGDRSRTPCLRRK
jgi:hypothetical protein